MITFPDFIKSMIHVMRIIKKSISEIENNEKENTNERKRKHECSNLQDYNENPTKKRTRQCLDGYRTVIRQVIILSIISIILFSYFGK